MSNIATRSVVKVTPPGQVVPLYGSVVKVTPPGQSSTAVRYSTIISGVMYFCCSLYSKWNTSSK